MDEAANESQIAQTQPMQQPQANEPNQQPKATERAQRADANVIYIGKKSVMGYVLAVVTQFNQGTPDVYIKARGKTISRAVDVAEIVRNRFLPEVKLGNIAIKTEEMDSEDGSKTKVSAIEIKLVK